MMEATDELAGLVAARICHDLASPLGAMGNGIELLEMMDLQGPEVELLSDSLRGALARLRVLRLAFGPAGDAPVGRAQIRDLVTDMGLARQRIDWQAGDVSRADLRMICLGLMCLQHAFPKGCDVEVGPDAGGWRLRARGTGLRIVPQTWDCLLRPGAAPSHEAALIHFTLLRAILRDAGRMAVLDGLSDGADLRLPRAVSGHGA